jgi:phospholipase C
VPAYDFLAREFVVCDCWFASLPTDTFPNRRYSIAGRSGNDDTTPSSKEVRDSPPAYTEKTIFEVLQEHGVEWNIFYSDIPFAIVYKRLIQDAQFTRRMLGLSIGDAADLEHAAELGDLPSVTWIEPNFSDFRESAAAASDDHPPGSITNGQRLVGDVYSALSRSPAWSKTLLIITYDEHGGFYDHVLPAGFSKDADHPAPGGPPDDNPRHARYGVRVPAFVISPWVQRGAAFHETFDHTTLLSTILRRFCPDAVGALGLRTLNAKDVGPILSSSAPRTDIPQAPEIAPPPPPPVARGRAADSFGDVLRKTAFGF